MNSDTGRIEVICGSMFSGKSEELIRRIRRAMIAKQKVQAFKPEIDDRYSFYFGIDNVFDTQPPYLPGTPFGTPTGLETGDAFDLFGRAFTIGANFRF